MFLDHSTVQLAVATPGSLLARRDLFCEFFSLTEAVVRRREDSAPHIKSKRSFSTHPKLATAPTIAPKLGIWIVPRRYESQSARLNVASVRNRHFQHTGHRSARLRHPNKESFDGLAQCAHIV